MYGVVLEKKRRNSVVKYKKNVSELLALSWGEDSSMAEKYISLSDYFMFIEHKNKKIAFAALKFIDKNEVFIIALLIHPDYQGVGMSKFIRKKLIFFYIKRILYTFSFISFFKDIWIIFRTANPRVYSSLIRFNLFPSHEQERAPTKKEFALARKVLKLLGQENELDEKKFIVNGAYKNSVNLIYDSSGVPLSKKTNINRFFKQNLKYELNEGNAFIFVGHTNLWNFFKKKEKHDGDKNFWEKYFRCYDILNRVIPYQDLINDLINEIDPKKGDKILDAGSGTGNLSIMLNKFSSEIYSLDNSVTALNRHRLKDVDAKTVQHDLLKVLPFKNDFFDKIVSNNTLYTLPIENLKMVLKEFFRVLKPGGKIVVSNIKKNFSPLKIYREHLRLDLKKRNFFVVFKDLITFIYPTIKMFYFNSKIKKNNKNFKYHFFVDEEQKNILQEVGFKKVSREKLVYAKQALMLSAFK